LVYEKALGQNMVSILKQKKTNGKKISKRIYILLQQSTIRS